jgi:PAP2 superfamily
MRNAPITIAFSSLKRTAVPLFIAALATGFAGCADTMQRPAASAATALPASPWASPTATMRWNEYASDLVTKNFSGQQRSVRTLAYVNLAINNAIVMARPQGVKTDGAAAGAAAAMLVYLFPKDASLTEARLQGEINAIGAGPTRDDFAVGVKIGQAAASNLVAVAKVDRFDVAWEGTVPTGAYKWSSRAQPAVPPLFPRLGEMKPFFLASNSEFRPPPPPAPDSPEFKMAVAELIMISQNRTTEQLRIAQYWENLTPPYAGGYWNMIARGAISEHGLSEADAVRILALMNMAMMDAFIACHEAKYVYWLARPPAVDPAIRNVIVLPNHPSYPANHGCVSTAAGTVLDAMLPSDKGRYTAMATQAAESRVYGGIHYRFDIDAGMEVGRKVARKALSVGLPSDRPYLPVTQ